MQYLDKSLDLKIKEFCELFLDRLPHSLIKDSIYYIECSERGLAFETICDHLSDYDIPISRKEYHIAILICNELKMDANSFKYLSDLINKEGSSL